MFSLAERAGTLAIAVALLFAAMRIHRTTKRRAAKPIGVVMAFLAGCAFLMTFVGSWMGAMSAKGAGLFFVAGLIVCAAIIIGDWWMDGKPDKPAFWAAFAAAAVIVFGVASIPKATGQIGDGAHEVGTQVQRIGNGK